MLARSSFAELLFALAEVLRGRRWYLFGAQAVNVHGRPRMTADVDVTLEIQREEVRGFVDEMANAGFGLTVTDVDDFVEATSVLPFMHHATGVPLDVVLSGSGLEALFLDRATLVEIEGVRVPVISPADLVVAKILAGRPKDIDDAAAVLRARAEEIDLAGVRALLTDIESALAQSDLLPALDGAIAEASRGRKGRST